MSSGLASAKSSYDPFVWLKWSGLVLAIVIALSTFGYWALGYWLYEEPGWTPVRCLFMVVITLTTIGYGDWLGIEHKTAAQWFTMALAVLGMGVPAFLISNVTALIVEGLFSDVFRRRRMDKRIEKLQDHFIVCGLGNTGYHCVAELLKTGRSFVVIDRDPDRLARATQELGEFLYVTGSAEDDAVLRRAGVERAAGLAACLADDKQNLYCTLSAHALNPRLRIVSKLVEDAARQKLLGVGAVSAVSPTAIGGMRVASELVRPAVVTFLDTMLRGAGAAWRFEELTVGQGSPMAGKTLSGANLRAHGEALVVAARAPGGEQFAYNPRADLVLQPGSTLVILARVEDLGTLRPLFAAGNGGQANKA